MMRRLWRNRWLRIATLLGLLAVWVLVPHAWEGRVLLSITETNGVHVSDLIGLAVVVGLMIVPGSHARHHRR